MTGWGGFVFRLAIGNWKFISTLALARLPYGLTFGARADVPQELPRIESQIVVIVPDEFNGIPAHGFYLVRLGRGLEHGQRPRRQLRRISRLAASFTTFFIAQSAGAGIPQKAETVGGDMPVLPLDFHAGAGGDVHLDRLGFCPRLHVFSIAQADAGRTHSASQRRRRESKLLE
jgi:hypothetical protein